MAETALQLRSNIFASLKFTAGATYTAGQITKINDTVGVVAEACSNSVTGVNREGVLIYRCEKIVVPKRAGTGLTLSVGQKVYYRSGGPDVTGATTGNVLCGRCLEDAGESATTVLIDLDGAKVA